MGLAFLPAAGMQARGAFVDFNTPGSLGANFSLNHQGAGILYGEAPNGGLNNSRAVDMLRRTPDFNTHTSAIFDQESFRFSQPGDRVELSQFVLRQNRDDLSVFWSFGLLGIVTDSAELLASNQSPNSFAHVYLASDPRTVNGVFVQTTVKNGSGPANSTSFNNVAAELITGHWYRYSAAFENISSSEILISALLEDWGTSGTAPLSTVLQLLPTTLLVATGDSVLEDNSVWGGFLSHAEGGADLIDNFSVVPLPGAGALLLSSVILVALRKKNSAGRRSFGVMLAQPRPRRYLRHRHYIHQNPARHGSRRLMVKAGAST